MILLCLKIQESLHFTILNFIVIPYEMTVITGDRDEAGTDQKITVTVFGAKGPTTPTVLDKSGDRFERDRADLIRLELEDVAPIKKMRIETDGKGSRPDWYLDKVWYKFYKFIYSHHGVFVI